MRLNQFPTKIRVSRKSVYEIRWTKEFKDPLMVGECHPVTKVITLKLDEPEEEIWWTLFHELLHAISLEWELDLSERKVQRIESSMFSIFKDLGWVMGKQPKKRKPCKS